MPLMIFAGAGRDLIFAIRQLWKNPGFTVVAGFTLAVGIGAATTIFSVVNAMVLRPLPFDQPDQLVRIWEVTPQGTDYTTSEPTFLDWRAMSRSFTDVAAYTISSINLTGADEPERLTSLAASHSLLPTLGIQPSLGRGFLPEEDAPGSGGAVLLTRRYWERRFGADPEIVGHDLTLGGELYSVIGVVDLPNYPFETADIVVPLSASPDAARSNHFITAVGRLAPGVSVDIAREEMVAIAARIGEAYPNSNKGWSTRLALVEDWLLGRDVRRTALILFGTVAFLLLLACANVSNLLMARGTVRRQELAVRAALGADRWRIIRQLLAESVMLAGIGAVLGLLLTAWAMPVIQSLAPYDIARLDEVAIDRPVLAFAVAATVLTSLIFGLTPALHVSGTQLQETLREDARSVVSGSRLRDILVVGELALAVVLLAGAGLMTHSFLRLQAVDAGFDPDNLLAVRLQLPGSTSQADRVAFFSSVAERVGSLPGVTGVGATFIDPYEGGHTSNRAAAADWDAQTPEDFLPIEWRSVTSGYFSTMGIPLRAGRFLDDRDGRPQSDERFTPVLVSEALADRMWSDGSPIGKRIVWSRVGGMQVEVVGIVGDVRDYRLDIEPRPTLYYSYAAMTWSTMTVLIRTTGASTGMAPAIRNEIRSLAPDIPIPAIREMGEFMSDARDGHFFLVRLFGLFAALGLALAVMGVYAIMTFQVAQRTREIGVRVTLGARPDEILKMVLRRSMARAAVGLLVGLVLAFALTRLMAGLLFETSATDVPTYALVILVLAATAVLATLIPARQATKVDPIQALAAE